MGTVWGLWLAGASQLTAALLGIIHLVSAHFVHLTWGHWTRRKLGLLLEVRLTAVSPPDNLVITSASPLLSATQSTEFGATPV